ncbi:hypothetical protein GOB57_08090 [Sinorhizobium meliloti]|nr:hypothetical protein [Sinorhizobium meliloti]
MSNPSIAYSWNDAADLIRSEIVSGRVRHLSVDVFDTLLFRTTAPESVTEATARFLSGRLGVSLERAVTARGDAWSKESAEAVHAGKDPDARSASLFKRWIGLLGQDDASEVAEAALAFELECETACLAPNPQMIEVLELAKAKGVEITALSDMYLSPAEVSSLLSAHGMRHLVRRVVTSGYLGRQKRTGRLFDWFLECTAGTDGLLHVGDDPVADGTMPAARGIRAISVFDRKRMLARQRLAAAARNAPAKEAALSAVQTHVPASVAHDVGFSRFGPVYTGFIHAVAARAVEDGVSSVWFLAREGWMLHELYNVVRQRGMVTGAPPSGYLYASRVATMRAQLKEFGDQEVGSVHSDTWSRTYQSTLSPLQLDDEALGRVLGGAGITPCDTVTAEGLQTLRSHPAFVAAVRRIGEVERQGLEAYLVRTGFPLSGKVAVVDVGWGGQIQENLERALRQMGATTELTGYYLGTDERAERRRKDTGLVMHGLVVDKCNNDGSGLGAFSHVQGIELATRAAHGSVKGYDLDGRPRLAPGSDKGRQAEEIDDPAISAMQEGILAFATGYVRAASVLGVNPSESVALARDVMDVGSIAPSRLEAEVITEMKNIANLGGDETLRLGGAVSLRHPRHAVRALRTTLWQEGNCATLVPWVGPLLFLALRRFKRLVPQRTGGPRQDIGRAVSAIVHDQVVEDALSMGLTTRRSELASSYRGRRAERTIDIGTLGDAVKLLLIRAAHGAPTRPAVSAIRSECRAIANYLIAHPAASGARAIVRRLR